jgi:hypothetical protein
MCSTRSTAWDGTFGGVETPGTTVISAGCGLDPVVQLVRTRLPDNRWTQCRAAAGDQANRCTFRRSVRGTGCRPSWRVGAGMARSGDHHGLTFGKATARSAAWQARASSRLQLSLITASATG